MMASALLIDDDKDLRTSLEAAANDVGLGLRTTGDWNEALALFHVLSPNLVIADYNLPGSEHGLRLLAEIKSLRPSVRVILISGVVDAADLGRAEALGVVERVLSKGDAIAMTKALLEEIRQAEATVTTSSEWSSVAQAYVNSRAVDQDHFEELDASLRRQAENRP
ncbi:MAG: response regulator [Acidimicrobiales bacterium]